MNIRTVRKVILLSEEDNEILENECKRSNSPSFSSYARQVLLNSIKDVRTT